MAKTLNQSGCHWISRDRNNDGDGTRRLFGGLRGRRVHRDNDIHVEGDKLRSKWKETINLTVFVSLLDDDSLSLDPSEVSQSISERLNLSCDGCVSFAGQQADPPRSGGL